MVAIINYCLVYCSISIFQLNKISFFLKTRPLGHLARDWIRVRVGIRLEGFVYHVVQRMTNYSKTPIYRGVWGQGNNRGKSGSAVNRGFVWFTLCMFSHIWGSKEMAAVYRGLR